MHLHAHTGYIYVNFNKFCRKTFRISTILALSKMAPASKTLEIGVSKTLEIGALCLSNIQCAMSLACEIFTKRSRLLYNLSTLALKKARQENTSKPLKALKELENSKNSI